MFDFNKLDKTKTYAAYFVPKVPEPWTVEYFKYLASPHFAIHLKAKQTVRKFKLDEDYFVYRLRIPTTAGTALMPVEQNYATHSAMFVYLEAHEYKGEWYESQWWIFESHIQTGVTRYPVSEIQTESDIYAYEENLDLKIMNDLIGTDYGKYDMIGFFNEFLGIKKSKWHDIDKGLFCTEYLEKCIVFKSDLVDTKIQFYKKAIDDKKLCQLTSNNPFIRHFEDTAREPVMQQYLANVSGKEIIKL